MTEKGQDKILRLLHDKVLLKQEVYDKTKVIFNKLKEVLSKLAIDFKASVKDINKHILTEFKNTSEHEVEFVLADETLVFVMHTNIFTFDSTHPIWRDKYVQEDSRRSFCGKIFIYNFLTDSFRYNRVNDLGYLIARVFVNREGHYFVEGKKQMGYLYNDFSTTVLDDESLSKLIETAIIYCLDFDPFTPPIEQVNEISVREVIDANVQSRIATGKRLGFQFESARNDVK